MKSRTVPQPLPFCLYVESDPDGNAPLFAAFENESVAQWFVKSAQEQIGETFEPEKWILVNEETMTNIPIKIS